MPSELNDKWKSNEDKKGRKMRNGFIEVPNMALGEMSDNRPYWS